MTGQGCDVAASGLGGFRENPGPQGKGVRGCLADVAGLSMRGRCGDGVGRNPVRDRAAPACGMGGALPGLGLLVGLVGDEVPSGAARSETERVLRGQGAIAVLAAQMVRA